MASLSIIFDAIPAIHYSPPAADHGRRMTIGYPWCFTTLQNAGSVAHRHYQHETSRVIRSLELFARILSTSTCRSRSTTQCKPSRSTRRGEGHVRLAGVTLRYPAADATPGLALNGHPAGSRMRWVGEDRIGKTPWPHWFPRLYDPAAAGILSMGIDIRTCAWRTWPLSWAWFSQEDLLLHATGGKTCASKAGGY